jgi:dipeptidyl aminopeptidase/acylaminoacyl peptidase
MRYRSLLAVTALAAMSASAQLPELVDRDLFFGEVEIGGAQLSPDGKYITFLRPHLNNRNIWIKKVGDEFSAARPLTAETRRPIGSYFWSRDSKFVLWVQDQGGDENYNIYAVNPAEATDGAAVPKTRNLTDAKGVRAFIYSLPKQDPDTLYIGLNDRDRAWHDLYQLKISTGEKKLLRQNTDRVTSWIFDNKGVLRMASRSAPNGDNEILRVEPDKMTKIYSCDVLDSCYAIRFDKDNKQVWFATNKGEADLIELTAMDPATGAVKFVERDPLKRVDFGRIWISEKTDDVLGTAYEDERMRPYFKNKAFEADYRWLQSKLPNRELNFVSETADESMALILSFSDIEPGEVSLFDRRARKLTPLYKVREKLPRAALSPMRAIRYPSSDGLEIPAFLTLPKGMPEKDLPLVVFPHGGPWSRDRWGYSTYPQFLANRGYAVLAPNFRGSTGYGKKFLNAGNQEWGRKMQDDLTWGVKYLVSKGIVNPKRVAIAGGSYGGYATLAGVAFTPDVYAAGVPIVAPSNLITLLSSIPPYWEASRKTFSIRMGDLSTEEGRQQLERQSPLREASKIKAPLLVVQGANDPRVNKRESDQIVVAVRDRGLPVEYLVAPDEGHGFARPINNLAMIAAMEKFLAKHIDGRYQASMPEAVAQRLKEITVDPKTVKVEALPAGGQ